MDVVDAAAVRRDTMVCAMARAVPQRGVCVGGLGTPLATVALLVAAHTRGTDMWILATDGGQICRPEPSLVTVTGTSRAALGASLRPLPFAELILSIVPRHHPFELMRPAQLDHRGRSNNVLVTGSTGPLRLPGCGGIGDATSVNPNLHYYLPRHDRRTLVAEVEYVSGGGRARPSGGLPAVPVSVITELCILRFRDHDAVVAALHAGVTPDEVRDRTGFPVVIPDDVATTSRVTPSEQDALARVDPLRVRDVEFLAGEARRRHLAAVVAAEELRAA